jgi:hypothetical protein
MLSLTEVVGVKLALPLTLSLTEVLEGVPMVPYIVLANMNVPGESSISLGLTAKL